MVFAYTWDVLVGEFDFGQGKPLPDDDESIINGFVDYDGITRPAVDHGQKKLALVCRAQAEESAGSCPVELEDHAIGAFVIRGKRTEGSDVPRADCGALPEEDFLACSQLLEDLSVSWFSLEMEADSKVRRFFSGCAKGARQDYSRNQNSEG